MDDLISRQAAIEAINSHFGFNIEEEYGSAVQEVINGLPSAQPEKVCIAKITLSEEQVREAVEKAKSEIVQVLSPAQPEIIRCKDCKFVGTDATCCLVCNREGMGLRPFHVYHDDFCSYGERKDE